MADEIIRLRLADYDEGIAFLNRVFFPDGKMDFPRLLPAWYRRDAACLACNYAVRRDGRIVAVVGAFPTTWHLNGTRLRLAGIGGVSTDPACRTGGLMTRLMTRVVADLRADGCDVSHLGGQRQRYGYFGYERCGVELSVHLNKRNVRDAWGRATPPVALAPLDESDAPTLARLQRLHARQLSRCARPVARFAAFLRHWSCVPLVGRRADGTVAGYLVANEQNGTVAELVAADDAAWLGLVRAWVERSQPRPVVQLPAFPGPRLHQLGAWAEAINVNSSGNWQVFNWPQVVGALLGLRHQLAPLPAGAVVIGVGASGPRLALRVRDGAAECTVTRRRADWTADPQMLMRVLFGPLPPAAVTALPPAAAPLAAWCPLPLSLPHPDHV